MNYTGTMKIFTLLITILTLLMSGMKTYCHLKHARIAILWENAMARFFINFLNCAEDGMLIFWFRIFSPVKRY